MIVDAQQGKVIKLGRLGENEARTVRFLIRDVLHEHPDAEFTLLNKRPGDQAAYPVPVANVRVDGFYLFWTVTSGDLTKKGEGVCELVATDDGAICKSVFYGTEVLDALDGSGTVPEPWTGWVTQVTDAADRAEAAATLLESPGAEAVKLAPGSNPTAVYAEGVFTFGLVTGDKGDPGDPGAPGVSPVVSITEITGGHRITITDNTGDHTADVMDGDPATIIDDTSTAQNKVWSANKSSTLLSAISGLPQDVKVDGTSVVTQGVANIPKATTSSLGVIKADGMAGVIVDNGGRLLVVRATASEVKAAEDTVKPLVPKTITQTTFYGLSKVAGVDLANETVTPGTYPDASKAAIQHMLGTDTNLANYEADTTADQAYAIGELFMLNGKLHQATAAIAVGDTLTVGTNCAVCNASDVFPHDVQVNGTSILSNGVANVPMANMQGNPGAIKMVSGNGIGLSGQGNLTIVNAISAAIKNGTNTLTPIAPIRQHESVFYGLAKAAGANMASLSDETVGVYPPAQLVAIQKMLGIYEAPWELIREDAVDNLTEADITINVDDDGNAFALTDIILLGQLEKQSSDAGSVGTYGSIYFKIPSGTYISAYCGTVTASESSKKTIYVEMLQGNNMVTVNYTSYYSGNGSASLQKRINDPNSESTGSTLRLYDGVLSFNEVVIKSVKGKYNYRLYGRHNWRT